MQSSSSWSSSCAVVLLAGVPAVGKSTLLQHLEFKLLQIQSNKDVVSSTAFHIVRFDDIFLHLTSFASSSHDDVQASLSDVDFDPQVWKDAQVAFLELTQHIIANRTQHSSLSPLLHKIHTQCVKSFLPHHRESTQTIIVLEDNFYYKSMRHSFYQIARQAEIGFGLFFLQASLPTCLDRNQARGLPIPQDVLLKMHSRMEFPDSKDESLPADRTCLFIDTEAEAGMLFHQTVDTLLEFAFKCAAEPIRDHVRLLEEKREASRLATQSSIVNQIELGLRKTVGTFLKQNNTIKEIAKKTSEEKKTVMDEWKAGVLDDALAASAAGSAESILEFLQQILLQRLERFIPPKQ